MFSKKLAILGAATLSAATVFAPASLAGSLDVQSIEIDISGYDLTTDEGSAAIVRKIESAAKKVCNVRTGPQTLAERSVTNDCMDAAIADALDSLSVQRARQAAAKANPTG